MPSFFVKYLSPYNITLMIVCFGLYFLILSWRNPMHSCNLIVIFYIESTIAKCLNVCYTDFILSRGKWKMNTVNSVKQDMIIFLVFWFVSCLI